MDLFFLYLYLRLLAGAFCQAAFRGSRWGSSCQVYACHIITAVANRNTDRGPTCLAHAGLRHPEIASGAELAKYLATLTWHNDWHPSIGVILLTYINPVYLRFGSMGCCWCFSTIYGLARPAFKPMKIGNRTRHRHWHFQRGS